MMSLDRGATLTSLDSELQSLEQGLVLARRRRNLRTAVQALPAEVLTMILAEAQVGWAPCRKYTGTLDAPRRVQYDLGWMMLCHVCSLWSETILNTPSLWCDVHCLALHPQSILRFLSLSNGLELSLTIDVKIPVDHDHVAQVIDTWLCGPVLRRTKRLVLSHFSQELLDTCLPYLSYPMPSLTAFIMESLEQDDTEWPDFLPASLFAERCPRLTSISLKNRILPWYSPLLSERITQFEIGFGDASDLDSAMPSMTRFLDLLQSMPALEALSLQKITPTPILPAADVRQVALPLSFRRLAVSVQSYRLGHFDLFKHLIIPPCAAAVAEILNDDDLDDQDMDALSNDTSHLFHVVGEHDGDSYHELDVMRTILSLRYHHNDARSTWTSRPRRPYPGSTLQDYRTLPGRHLWIHGDDVPEDSTVLAHLSKLPLDIAQCCTFATDFMALDLSAEEWHIHFDAASDTRRISLAYSGDGRQLFDALSDTRNLDGEERSRGPLFPKLETVVLHAHPSTEDGVHVLTDIDALDVMFLEFVRVRGSWQVPLREVLVARALADRTQLWDQLVGMVVVNFF
ncbi:hypothetical protein PENSPDRAFT_757978, partial [Peniophora sp. CONT]